MRAFLLFGLMALLLLLGGCANPAPGDLGGFCGTSTKADCLYAGDCVTGGCSGQVCGSKFEESSAITTCEYRSCYDAQQFDVACTCRYSMCQWVKAE